MKNKLLNFIFALTFVLTGAIFFTACGGGGGDKTPTPKTVQATVSVTLDFDGEDYITGYNLSFGDSGYSTGDANATDAFTVAPHETTHFDDAVLKISLKRGVNPETLGVTENYDKPFTKSVNTANYKNEVVIKMPFAENLDYSFALTEPTGIYQDYGFRIDDLELLNYKDNEALVELFDNTEIYVQDANGEGQAGWIKEAY